MDRIAQLQESHRRHQEAAQKANELKAIALVELQMARQQGQDDLSVEMMRYTYASFFWESRHRQELKSLREYNLALQSQLTEGNMASCLQGLGQVR